MKTQLKLEIMRKAKIYMFAAVLLVAGSQIKAQVIDNQNNEQSNDEIVTLLDNSNHVGGYGAFSMRYFSMENRDGMMFGGRGGVIVGHGIAFGLTGTGFITQPNYDAMVGDDAMVAGGYGGIFIEPILLPKFPVHIAFPVTIGAGGIGYSINRYYDNNNNNLDNNWMKGRGFLILEPGVEVEFNVFRYFRFALGASYKMTSNIDLRYDNNSAIVPRNALKGATMGVTFKFGSF
jgi:hypothetical protein